MILGPTASGKTSLALRLAEVVDCEIISIDSALVYKRMDIGTAKPTKEEMQKVKHHLIDIIEPDEVYSAADFKEDCERLIKEIRQRGKLPLIVGGTMLYAKALREGMSELPSTDPAVREKVLNELEKSGLEPLYEQLKKIDPETAQRLKPGDTQRITRAIEVYEMTGKPLSEVHQSVNPSEFKIDTYALMPPDRAELHKKIARRFDQMLEQGFVKEVEGLRRDFDLNPNMPSMRCVGYRQCWEYLDGNVNFDEFREKAIAATRQLAKRQITWLRSMPELTTYSSEDKSVFEKLKNSALSAL